MPRLIRRVIYFGLVIIVAIAALLFTGSLINREPSALLLGFCITGALVSSAIALSGRPTMSTRGYIIAPWIALLGTIVLFLIINASQDEFAGASGVPRNGAWESVSKRFDVPLPTKPIEAVNMVVDAYSAATGEKWRTVGISSSVDSGTVTGWGIYLLHYDNLGQRWYSELALEPRDSGCKLVSFYSGRSPAVRINRWLALTDMANYSEPHIYVGSDSSGELWYSDDMSPDFRAR